MIQALYQALQISVSWEHVSEIQSIKGTDTHAKHHLAHVCLFDQRLHSMQVQKDMLI